MFHFFPSQIPHTWIRKEMATLFVERISKLLFACYNRKLVREVRVNASSNVRKAELLEEEIQDEENIYIEVSVLLPFKLIGILNGLFTL